MPVIQRSPTYWLLEVTRQLHVFTSQQEHISGSGAQHGDNEMPPEYIRERECFERAAVRNAALVAGETMADANCFADDPHGKTNPYNMTAVRMALALRAAFVMLVGQYDRFKYNDQHYRARA